MTTLISETFAKLKSENRMAFMPFITAGDPDLATTVDVLKELSRQGVDLIEVGFPYSDPIADGPVIQESYTRALNNGFHVHDLFEALKALSADESVNLPALVGMVSYAIIFRYGAERFLKEAADAGFSGLIVPDLPGDEAGEFVELTKAAQLDLVQLVSPLTPEDRTKRIVQSASGFIYCIAVAGTTGVRDELPAELTAHLESLRSLTDLPLAVGFGISKPEHVDTLRGKADGFIIGSAIVKQFAAFSDPDQTREAVIASIGKYAGEMAAATKG
ncbi:tryptophan synthase subunit alpha [Gimesia chilikensis]|nr:tryptophan synthase subunit alpha [Gimesia chilikensis]MCR9232454.1 tryptophan synthase subunit alpha [bacterium]QDT83006.1 Tryptophan synthase alpha chain [Gimesia chilikensis]